ncbi:DUF4003 family protein [Sporosarcina sp. BI001-red]|uniref:DUF4003 family protein n=1 Tax=Sporosarcina sp. BI001-red TaxID=2282866 RepID=UPI001314CF2C|nr:DUF4003 family protein [Sporosarcina sp. BI001-red]
MDWETVKIEMEWTHEKVSSLAGWSVDEKTVLTIAVYYVLSQKEFSSESFLRTMEALEKRAGWLSPVRGNFLPMLASFLDSPTFSADDAVQLLFTKQQIIRKTGFKNTVHSYLAAILMTSDPATSKVEAKQAKRLYNAMKKQHLLLTSDEDYSYAMLLGKANNDAVQQAALMRRYFDELNKVGFKSGTELQWLSQVLTMDCCSFKNERVIRAEQLMSHIRKRVNLKPIHYPVIGFLAILECQDNQVEELIRFSNFVAKGELFKWHKTLAFSFASGYFLQQMIENKEVPGFSKELNVLIQQALMAATVTTIASTTTSALS